MATIKELLDAELFAQVQAALKGKGADGKDVEIGIINDGNMIPKAKFDQQTEKLRAAETLAADTKSQLDALKNAGDPAALSDALAKAQEEAKTLKATYEQQLKDKDMDYAIRSALTDAHDADIVAGLLNRAQIKVGAEGQLEGLEGQVSALKAAKPFLFKGAEAKPPIAGLTPADGSASAGRIYSRSELASMTPDQINANWDSISQSLGTLNNL